MAKYNKIESLKFYIYYIYYDLKSTKFDNKQLSKTIQKNLFQTNEQLKDFEKVIAGLMDHKDLNKSLLEVAKIYQPKRKRIRLDESVIKEVQMQDRGAVEHLNEYLNDTYEDKNTIITHKEISDEEIKLEISSKMPDKTPGIFISDIILNENQSDLIRLFLDKSFNVNFNDLDLYCKENGVLRNQLIDSINESCFEILDDVLIEEENDVYIMNEVYFQKLKLQ